MLNYIMKTASDNATTQFNVLDDVSRNVANINTPGFKNVRFDAYLRPGGQLAGVQRTDFSQGDRLTTDRPLDVAIVGFGFMPVTQPDGTTAYTRDGSLSLNSEGYLVTNRGDMIGKGIQVPPDHQDIFIRDDGTVDVTTTVGGEPKTVGKIDVVRFNNPEGLKDIGYNKLVATQDSGDASPDKESVFRQGQLERANVNVFAQVDQILRLNGSILANINVIRFTDDIFKNAVNLQQ